MLMMVEVMMMISDDDDDDDDADDDDVAAAAEDDDCKLVKRPERYPSARIMAHIYKKKKKGRVFDVSLCLVVFLGRYLIC